MRRYELMLILRPDVADDKAQAVIDRTTRQLLAAGSQIVKVAPWGRRRLAYPIDKLRDGFYAVAKLKLAPEAADPLDRVLRLNESVIRHLVTRVERPVRAARAGDEGEDEGTEGPDLPSADDEDDFDTTERIDESESEAAPAAID